MPRTKLQEAEWTIRRIEQMLCIPAAEYVPAIGDVFLEIDAYFKGIPTTRDPGIEK